MSFTKEQLLEFLAANCIVYNLYMHAPLFICEQAAEIIAQMQIPGMGIKKSVFKG